MLFPDIRNKLVSVTVLLRYKTMTMAIKKAGIGVNPNVEWRKTIRDVAHEGVKNTQSSVSAATNGHVIKKDPIDKSLLGFGTAFLASSSLAIAGHTTKLFDIFGEMLKKPINFVLDIASIMLGTITAAGFLADDDTFNGEERFFER